jgi:transposase
MRVAPRIDLADEEREQLLKWSRGRSTPHRLVLRASIVLQAAQGLQDKEIAANLGASRHTVALWRRRFLLHRFDGMKKDAPRQGRKPQIPLEVIDAILGKTLYEKPRGATHWSTRTMARAVGVSHSTVRRVWKAHRLQPHRVRTFKVSKDPHFAEKVRDIVGLYLDPPQKAAVFSVDEKTQIQALDRTQTILPVRPGLPETRTHDYRRNGQTDLFAALNILDGTVMTQYHRRHRHREFLVFLRTIDQNVDPQLEIHLVMDNLSAHKHKKVERWFTSHPRFRVHFTPTGATWINQVERWFSNLTEKRIRRGTFRSVTELMRAIDEYVEVYHENPRPFLWTAQPDQILTKVAKAARNISTDPLDTPH